MQFLKNSQIYNLLPASYQTITTQCLSYAINQAISQLVEYASKIGVTSSIDDLPESILDLLAIELNLSYYSQNFDVIEKRNIIKSALTDYMKAGSTVAIEEMLAKMFGAAKISEWYEYGGEPFHFRVYVSGMDVNSENVERLENSINGAKNVRSVLDTIQLKYSLKNDLFHSEKVKTSVTVKVEPYDTIVVLCSDSGTVIDGGSIVDPANTIINAGTI
jgi:phage tail P2-like protein